MTRLRNPSRLARRAVHLRASGRLDDADRLDAALVRQRAVAVAAVGY